MIVRHYRRRGFVFIAACTEFDIKHAWERNMRVTGNAVMCENPWLGFRQQNIATQAHDELVDSCFSNNLHMKVRVPWLTLGDAIMVWKLVRLHFAQIHSSGQNTSCRPLPLFRDYFLNISAAHPSFAIFFGHMPWIITLAAFTNSAFRNCRVRKFSWTWVSFCKSKLIESPFVGSLGRFWTIASVHISNISLILKKNDSIRRTYVTAVCIPDFWLQEI